MADLWRDFWLLETGTGQQGAQLNDRYMMIIIMWMKRHWGCSHWILNLNFWTNPLAIKCWQKCDWQYNKKRSPCSYKILVENMYMQYRYTCCLSKTYFIRFLVNGQRETQIPFYVFIFIFNSLHVSSTSCSSSGETNCVNTTSGNCHSVLVAGSCAGWECFEYIVLIIRRDKLCQYNLW